MTCVIIDYIIPDIPLKIKQEISRRKLLAYAALISKDPKEVMANVIMSSLTFLNSNTVYIFLQISSCYRAVL